ncbi:MAG: nucleotide exchange factor GrpE [Anaerolineae bacterium]|nr:nucleotide exchange factor GrpE [Gemmatimonadaceae bacterium]
MTTRKHSRTHVESETMDRSDEVASSAAPQGDGAPDPSAPEQLPVDSYLDTDGSAAESTGATVVSDPDDFRATLSEDRERYMRLAAEFDNYRKRSARERHEAGARAQGDLVKQFVDVLDDIARFAHIDASTVSSATVVEGVEMVEKKLMKALGTAGLETINPVGEPFDPQRHEAVATEAASTSEEDHTVSKVYQQGYVFNGQLLRPARVVVRQFNG